MLGIPRLLVLDNIFTSLNKQNENEITELLKNCVTEVGTSILIMGHKEDFEVDRF